MLVRVGGQSHPNPNMLAHKAVQKTLAQRILSDQMEICLSSQTVNSLVTLSEYSIELVVLDISLFEYITVFYLFPLCHILNMLYTPFWFY